jgi:hypothetical protein
VLVANLCCGQIIGACLPDAYLKILRRVNFMKLCNDFIVPRGGIEPPTLRFSASEWRHYSFYALGKVRTLRFVELCREYGYGSARGQVKEHMTPLAEWEAVDRAEMAALLDIAARDALLERR